MKPWRARLAVEELEGRILLSTVYSSNWSGYAALTSLTAPQSNAVSAVAGSWIVPSVTGTKTAYSAVWVGIDGYSSGTVEQIGTEQDIIHGRAVYSAWYEMYPAYPVTLSMTISPGDSITAQVSYVSAAFQLQITDTPKNGGAQQTFMTTQTLATAQRSSAEWIVEAPSAGGVLPLANFGSVKFSAATATINTATGPIDNSSWQSTAIDMVAGRTVIASTSSLTDASGASSFTVTTGGSSSGTGGGGHHRGGPELPVDIVPGTPAAVIVIGVPATLPGQPALPPPAGGLGTSAVVPATPLPAPEAIRASAAISGIGFATDDTGRSAPDTAPGVPEQAPAPDDAPAAASAARPESPSSVGLAAGDSSVEAVTGYFASSFLVQEEIGGLTADGAPALDIASGAGLALLVLALNLQPPAAEPARPSRRQARRFDIR